MDVSAEALTIAEQAGPYIPVLVVVAGGIVVGLFNRWNKRREDTGAKMPSIEVIWKEQREMRGELDTLGEKYRVTRRERDSLKDGFLSLRTVFLNFVERAQRGGPFELTAAEHRALEVPVLDHPDEDDTLGS